MVRKGFKQAEIGEIPSDWEQITLGDYVTKVGSGVTPKGGSSVYKEYGRPFVRSQNVGWGYLRLSDLAFIDETTHHTFPATELKENDVLLNITGASIGRCAIASAEVARGNVNQHVCIIRTNRYLNQNYVCYLLLSSLGQKQIDSFQAGGNREGLNFGQIKSFLLPKPKEVEEQKAIAKALSEVDELIVSLEKLIAKKRDIKTATMQQLLTGKKRLPGFGEGKGYKQTELGEIPEDWEQIILGNHVIKVGSGITPKGGSNVYKEFGRPFVRSQNVGWGYLKLSDLSFIDEATHQIFPATELKENDILLNITGASIGRCAIANAKLVGGNVNQHVCIIRADSSLDQHYVCYLLLSSLGQKQIDSFQAGGNREGLNFGQIKSFLLPRPKLVDEQKAIAKAIFDADELIFSLEKRLAKTKSIKQGMMQELLTGRTRLI